MARRRILVHCEGCAETFEATPSILGDAMCGTVRPATEAEAEAHQAPPAFEVVGSLVFEDDDDAI